MTTRDERECAKLTRDDLDARASALGHAMVWRLGPNATRKGHHYHFIGDCSDCGANITCSSGGSSCQGIRDGRKVECSGPGTAVLTEIETGRANELAADAVAEFLRQIGGNQ